jgi:hypothetical protein
LSFVTQAGMDTMPVVAKPATPLLANGNALGLCASSCESPVISGRLSPWTGNKPPNFNQCTAKLAKAPSYEYVPVRVGQTACFFASPGTSGFFTVLTEPFPVSARRSL